MTTPTMRICDGAGDEFLTINAEDFDSARHERWPRADASKGAAKKADGEKKPDAAADASKGAAKK